jgi:hypothetical protein
MTAPRRDRQIRIRASQRAFAPGKAQSAVFAAALDTPVDTAGLDDLLASRAPGQT